MWMFDHNHEGMTDDETIALSVLMVRAVRREKRGELKALAEKNPEDLTDSERSTLKMALWLKSRMTWLHRQPARRTSKKHSPSTKLWAEIADGHRPESCH